MSLRLPLLPRSFRWLIIVWAGIVFLWISLEDNHALPVAILGTGSVLLFAAYRLLTRLGGRTIAGAAALVGIPLLGGLVGMASAVGTAALMFLKTAIHAHIFPDYPAAQIIAMLERVPAWAAAGGLVGCGILFALIGTTRGVSDEQQLS